MSYAAKVLADSIAYGVRLTTLEVTFPRFILAEFNTHRVLSRNSASSRAIPVEKRIAQVRSNPFVPEAFGKNKSGMQASADLGGWRATLARWIWLLASKCAVVLAWCMSKLGVHKQHANRILEPFVWHTVVVTATEWANFSALRTHKAAQPEMQITAKLMRDAMDASTPVERVVGEWHAPYLDPGEHFDDAVDAIVISVARCAAVSYERQDAKKTLVEYRTRHDRLAASGHWSPFEHVAKVATDEEQKTHAFYAYTDHGDPDLGGFVPAFIGNFRTPWLQYRKTFDGESVFTPEEGR